MEQYMPFIWIGFAIIMAVCEAATTQLVSIWFVLGAICAAITTVFTPSILIQLAVFLVVTLISMLVTRPLVKKLRNKNAVQTTNSDSLIGKIGVTLTDISDAQSVGQVKISGKEWSARSDFAPILKNTKVKVLAIEGVKLIVEPLK
ncbi:MAG: NfeD family protein [Clostridia bacterium]|nr:NfeD family protein [Clostridia bacterium]